MITKKQFIKNGIAGIGAAFGISLFACKENSGEKLKNKKNPFEYDIEKYKKINESEILYKEAEPLKINAEKLYALAITFDNRLIVSADKNIFLFNKNKKIEKQWKPGSSALCIASDREDIFLGMQDHVEIFDIHGKKKNTWDNFSEKTYITSIAVRENHIAIADYGNRFVWLFDRDGALQTFIGQKDDAKKAEGLVIPSPYFDVAFDEKGFLWLANTGKVRVEKYNLKGELKAKWGEPGMAIERFSGCCNPSHFALLPSGGFVTAEKGLERVKLYDAKGAYKGVVAGPSDFITGTVGLDLAVDNEGKIYVLDPGKKLIRIFIKK